jgi:hypothetical protein
MTDLETLVRQTSNPSILKMQQRLYNEVVELGKLAMQWKEGCHALQLALETERDVANLYAKQVAHWIGKHDALLEQQLQTVPQEWNDENVIAWCVARGIKAARPTIKNSLTVETLSDYQRGYAVALADAEEAIDDECRERVVTASDCIEIVRNLGEEKENS